MTCPGKHVVAFCVALGAAGLVSGSARAQVAYKDVQVKQGGTITGTVRLDGLIPQGVVEPVTKDNDYCGKKKTSPRLLVGKNGGVGNSVVFLEQIGEGKQISPAARTFLRQRRCEYEPHIVLLMPGDRLEIVNDDPLLHNIHAYDVRIASRSLFNIAQPVKGQRTTIAPEHLKGVGEILTTCDAGHPWMSAYIVRAAHPYYTLTDADGHFRLSDVPPGEYTLKMWHEGVATRASRQGTPPTVEEPYEASRHITVPPNGMVPVNFSFSLKASAASQ